MAVNNAAAVHRPNLWTTVDDPGNFCDGIWRDPGILKFTPLCHMEKPFQVRDENGKLTASTEVVGDMPCVFGYRRNEAFNADQFLHEDTFNWGNHSKHVDSYGIKGSRSVFLVALRMLFFLGVRTVNLLGCDFKMRFRQSNYAFDQDRSRSSVAGNNSTYRALNTRLEHLLPHFEQEGFKVFNCTPDSGLKVFPERSFEDAIDAATSSVPKLLTTGMYDRAAMEKGNQEPSLEIGSQNPKDGIPIFTLVTLATREGLETLKWTWRTWRSLRPELFDQPPIVMHTSDVDPRRDLAFAEEANSKCVFVDPIANQGRRNRWTKAWFDIPAKHVKTDWWLKLEFDAVCDAQSQWLFPSWFATQSDANVAFIAHRWGYSKPADFCRQLNEWNAEHRGKEPVELAVDPEADRVEHDAVSTWFFMARTDWTKQASRQLSNEPPAWDHAQLAWYLAASEKKRVVRANMKQFGWDHSFSRRWNAAAVSKELLPAAKVDA